MQAKKIIIIKKKTTKKMKAKTVHSEFHCMYEIHCTFHCRIFHCTFPKLLYNFPLYIPKTRHIVNCAFCIGEGSENRNLLDLRSRPGRPREKVENLKFQAGISNLEVSIFRPFP
jgi:hypothetical protein